MRENIFFYFMQTHVLFIFSLVLLWSNTTAATSFGHKLVVAAGGATNTCINNERQALLGFKARLLDPYDVLSTWRPEEEEDCCKWSGVSCDIQTGHVTMLDLGYVGGEISPSLLNLTYLNHLYLSYCSFHGTIPAFIGNMTQLISLGLSYNQFTGSFPKSICSLTALTVLDLEGNQFVGTIPMSIGYLTNLTTIDLSWNKFSGIIPRSIGSLTKLTYLSLSENSLHGTIPPEFGNLTNLDTLSLYSLDSCTIENLDWLSSLSSLSYLEMDGTSLAKANNWVNAIIGLQNLSFVYLGGCDLSKVMHPYSSVVNSNSSITHLYLDNNNLNSSSYRWLCPLLGKANNLSRNALLGEIPKDIGQMTELEALDLSKNSFSGGLPTSMSKMNFLNYLDVSDNNLSGRIPSGTQLQSFEPSRYIGNAGLCGPPVTKYCPGDKELEVTLVVGDQSKSDGEALDELMRWFYIGGAAGFPTGFWMVVGTLLLNRRVRHAFFQCQDSLKDWVYVKVAVFMAKWRRVARA